MSQFKENWNNYWYYNGRLNRANLIKTPIYILFSIMIAIFFGSGFVVAWLVGVIVDDHAPDDDREEVKYAMGFLFGALHCLTIIFYLSSVNGAIGQ